MTDAKSRNTKRIVVKTAQNGFMLGREVSHSVFEKSYVAETVEQMLRIVGALARDEDPLATAPWPPGVCLMDIKKAVELASEEPAAKKKSPDDLVLIRDKTVNAYWLSPGAGSTTRRDFAYRWRREDAEPHLPYNGNLEIVELD